MKIGKFEITGGEILFLFLGYAVGLLEMRSQKGFYMLLICGVLFLLLVCRFLWEVRGEKNAKIRI